MVKTMTDDLQKRIEAYLDNSLPTLSVLEARATSFDLENIVLLLRRIANVLELHCKDKVHD